MAIDEASLFVYNGGTTSCGPAAGPAMQTGASLPLKGEMK